MSRGSQKQPRRSCLSCREQRGKLALVRLVRASDGSVHVDERGNVPGRGGYLCELADCWEHALESGQIERSLRTAVTPQDRVTLQDYARRFTIVEAVGSAQAATV
jgi:predicted RNA-binding protein YlxR (DUF448 family)